MIVIYDACVLYSSFLRDILMEVAAERIFFPRWTDRIHDEWIAAAIANNKSTLEKLTRTRNRMNMSVPDCLITHYEERIETLTLPDPGDRHVLAAAITAGASVIVTKNLRHFPAEILAKFNTAAKHPDDFLAECFAADPSVIIRSAKRMRSRYIKPALSADQYLDGLTRQDLPRLVACMRPLSDQF